MTTPTVLRNTDLASLIARLEGDQARKVDVIVPRDAVDAEGGRLVVTGTDSVPSMTIQPGPEMIETTAQRLRVPVQFLRELSQRGSAFAPEGDDLMANLEAEVQRGHYAAAFDNVLRARLRTDAPQTFMLRTFAPEAEGGPSYGRAVLSSRYSILDNKDVLLATLAGVQESGVEVSVDSCDLTDKRMRVRLHAPAVGYVASEFLKGYRNPFTGRADPRHTAPAEPLVFAGFELSNSELGFGAFSIVPRFLVQICTNGLTIVKDAMRAVHLGAKVEEGEITWAKDTQRAQLEVMKLKARDAVAKFLDPAYLETTIRAMEATAATPLDEPTAVLERVQAVQGWTEEEAQGILSMFVKGGQVTAGGVLQAITAHAQDVADPERAAELEAMAIPAMELAASVR
jgi:hypothetical protein